MKSLRVFLSFLALSLCAAAQTLATNVPGVTLSGPLNDLTITNNSQKAIIAAYVLYFGADGKVKDGHRRMFILDRPKFLAVGDSERLGTFHNGQGAEGIVSADVVAAIFADGEFQGGDDRKATTFRRDMEAHFQSIRAVFQLAQANNWSEVQRFYDEDSKGDIWKAAAASRLLPNHDKGGDIKAYKHYSTLPTTTWKAGLLNKLKTVPGVQELADWFSLLPVYAQNHTFCCTAPWPQGTGTDAYHADQWSYYCADSNPDIPCPPAFESTPWEGISATCTAIPPAFAYTTGTKIAVAQDLPTGTTWFTLHASSTTSPDYRLVTQASCHDTRLFGYQPEYAQYHKFCEDVTTAAPEKDSDTTQYICGAQKLGYIN